MLLKVKAIVVTMSVHYCSNGKSFIQYFLVILKQMLQYYKKILYKCILLYTTYIPIYVPVSNIQSLTSVLPGHSLYTFMSLH